MEAAQELFRGLAAAGRSAVKMEEVVACPDCGGKRTSLWRRGTDRLHRMISEALPYHRCHRCHLIFLAIRPTEEESRGLYPDDYQPYHPQEDRGHLMNQPTTVERWLRRFENPFFRGGRRLVMKGLRRIIPDPLPAKLAVAYASAGLGGVLLDFGCGSDLFLNEARQKGWQTVGMDISPKVVELLRISGHCAHVVSPSAWGELADASVDVVRTNHVLEHLYRPRETLQALHGKMKPGGRLHVVVPNPQGISSRVFRSYWRGLECPRHVMHYSPEVLGRLLASCGFSGIQIVGERITKDLARSLGYLLCEHGWVEDRMVEQMKGEPLLNEWLAPFMWMAGHMGWGDRLHAFAIKP